LAFFEAGHVGITGIVFTTCNFNITVSTCEASVAVAGVVVYKIHARPVSTVGREAIIDIYFACQPSITNLTIAGEFIDFVHASSVDARRRLALVDVNIAVGSSVAILALTLVAIYLINTVSMTAR